MYTLRARRQDLVPLATNHSLRLRRPRTVFLLIRDDCAMVLLEL